MNVNQIDTNIQNYTVFDLKKIYKLNDDYDVDDINTYHNKLIEKCKGYTELLYFFEQCKNRLLYHHYNIQIQNNKSEQIVSIKEKEYNTFSLENRENRDNTITKLIIINSKFRKNFNNTYSNDFIIEFPYTLNNVTSLKLKSVECINSSYAINNRKKNNIFFIDGNAITIPEGNYTSIELITELNILLAPYNITATFDDYTARVTISSTTSTNFNLNFNVNNLEFYNTFGYILGFRRNPVNLSNSYLGESILNIRGDKYFYIYLDDYVNNSTYDNIISLNGTDFFYKNIIGRITNVADIYNIQFEDNSDKINKIRYYFGKADIRKINIRLLDENGELLDNNNTDFSLTLEIQQKI